MHVNKKDILTNALITTIFSTGALILGINIGKNRYSPKDISANLYIDYTTNPNRPDIYIEELDSSVLKNNPKYIIVSVKHIRK